MIYDVLILGGGKLLFSNIDILAVNKPRLIGVSILELHISVINRLQMEP